jgi:hypothetical protein
MLAAIGCGSSGGGGTGGTAGPGGNAGKAGASGAAGNGAAGATGVAGNGAAGATGAAGSGAAGSGAAGATGAAGSAAAGASGNAGATGSAGTGGVGGAFGPTTLLVDDDFSDNNDPNVTAPVVSPSDTLFSGLLTGESLVHSTFVVPSDTDAGPSFTQLSNVKTIIWYTGQAFGTPPTLSNAQQTTLENWLDLGGKTLLLFSQDLIWDLDLQWTDTGTNTFAKTYMGLAGGQGDVNTAAGNNLTDINYTVSGNTAVLAFTGLSFAIDGDTPANFATTADAVNPSTGTDVLLTTLADPAATGTDAATPVASGYTKGTSKVVYVGIPLESIHGAPSNTAAQLFHAVLKYTGLKTN